MNKKLTFSEFQELVKLLVPDAICYEYANGHYDAEGFDIRIQYDNSYAIYPWFCQSRYHLHSDNLFSLEETVNSVVVAVLKGDAAFEDYGDGGYETVYDRWYALAHWVEIDQRMKDLGGS
jgi:hypothetical protein